MWFKKKNKCFHEWKLSDYRTYVDITIDIEEIYELTCLKCSKSRNVDAYEFGRMKQIGFIK